MPEDYRNLKGEPVHDGDEITEYYKNHWNETEEYDARHNEAGASTPLDKFRGLWSETDREGEDSDPNEGTLGQGAA